MSIARSYATGSCEPCQDRDIAALNSLKVCHKVALRESPAEFNASVCYGKRDCTVFLDERAAQFLRGRLLSCLFKTAGALRQAPSAAFLFVEHNSFAVEHPR